MNAIDYIRKSTAFNAYPWIKNLVESVLQDEPTAESIERLVFGTSRKEVAPTSESLPNDQQLQDGDTNVSIRRVVSIDSVKNVGLLDIGERLMFNEGLNILYGKNGAGKSSVYAALCQVLGKRDNHVLPNLYNQNDASSVQITYMDIDGLEHDLKWKTGTENQNTNVMVFDNRVANLLVEQEQVNDFDFAHLRVEYFSYIQDALDKLETTLQEAQSYHETAVDTQSTILSEKAPFVLTETDLSKEWLRKQDFTEDDRVELNRIKQELVPFQVSTTAESIKNVENAKIAVERILSLLGSKIQGEEWVIHYDHQYFERVNTLINDYNAAKSVFKARNNTVGVLPADWAQSELWQAFIASSIDFVNSLEDRRDEFTDETCVYCLQPLETDRSKQLMAHYRALRDEHSKKLKNAESQLGEYSSAIDRVVHSLCDCYETVAIIESVFDQIGRQGQTVVKITEPVTVFGDIKTRLDNQRPVTPSEFLQTLDLFYKYHIALWKKLNDVARIFKDSGEGRKRQEEELLKLAEPLQRRLSLQEMRQSVMGYIDGRASVARLSGMLADVSGARRANSTLKTRFTNEEVLKSFEEMLKQEYHNLDFQPPDVWKIRSSTSRDVTKRVYSLNDRKLSQIFSEGERKIHALADFFAECELNRYKGVYVFDDPVNSLDENKMEYVARRILKLVQLGNQVFVFTHNLVFLNLLNLSNDDKVTNITRVYSEVVIDSGVVLSRESIMKKKLVEIKKRMDRLANQDEQEISEWELRNVYDLMSGYLEDYVEIVLFNNIINRYRPNIMMNSLGNIRIFNASTISEIESLYRQTSRKGSRHSHPIDTPVPQYAELLSHVSEMETYYHHDSKKRQYR